MNPKHVMGSPCKRGHCGLRYRASRACVECQKDRGKRPEVRALQSKLNKSRYRRLRVEQSEQQKAYRRTPRGRALRMLQGVAKRSRKKSLKGSITLDWLERKLTAGVCELTGLPFDFSAAGIKGPFAPSLDRIDSKTGYEQSNCRVILWALNTAFSWWGAEAFREIAVAWLACSECGDTHDRDVNAARNILAGSRCLTSVRGNESSDSSVPLSRLRKRRRETGTETMRTAA
jgi:hypothetical protein